VISLTRLRSTSQTAAVRGDSDVALACTARACPFAPALLRTEVCVSKTKRMHLSSRSGCSDAQAVSPVKTTCSMSEGPSKIERKGMRFPKRLRKYGT